MKMIIENESAAGCDAPAAAGRHVLQVDAAASAIRLMMLVVASEQTGAVVSLWNAGVIDSRMMCPRNRR